MMDYIRLANGLEGQTSELLPTNSNIYEVIKRQPRKDQYLSLYRYNDQQFEEFQKTRSVKGITDVKTNRLLWDFDSETNIEKTKTDAVELCARLIESGVPEEKIRTFFSGNKGFHVEIIVEQPLTRQEFVNITYNMADGLETFDTRINDHARVIRAPLTKHHKSELFKIPLEPSQLRDWSMDDIKVNATDISDFIPRKYYNEKEWQISLPEPISILKTVQVKKVGAVELTNIKGFDINDIDFTKCPKWLSKERYAIQEGFFYGSDSVDKGERNIAFMILAATYRNQGFDAEHTLALLTATADKQAARTGEDAYTAEQLEREIINTVFNSGWKGGIYAHDEPLLVVTRHRFSLVDDVIKSELIDISNVGIDFMEFAKNIDANTVKTGLKSLDDNVLITSGMMVSLLAAPGAGKTSFANTFVEHLSKQGESTIYFSLDMYKNLLFTRLLQKYSGYPMQKILNQYKQSEADDTLIKAYSQVVANYSNTHFNFRSGPTVDEIDAEIIRFRDTSGKKPKLVVIDYLEKVQGPFTDATANSGYNASRLSDVAKKHDLVILLLVQPQKSAGDPREELTSYRKIKGASVIEQDSRVIMTLSRPGYNPKEMANDKFATVSVVKNNMGNLCQLDYGWDGLAGELRELSREERAELAELRKGIAEEKAKSDRGYDL